MLVLFETAAGFALFKVLDEGKVKEVDDLWKEFETPAKAKNMYVDEVASFCLFTCPGVREVFASQLWRCYHNYHIQLINFTKE